MLRCRYHKEGRCAGRVSAIRLWAVVTTACAPHATRAYDDLLAELGIADAPLEQGA